MSFSLQFLITKLVSFSALTLLGHLSRKNRPRPHWLHVTKLAFVAVIRCFLFVSVLPLPLGMQTMVVVQNTY